MEGRNANLVGRAKKTNKECKYWLAGKQGNIHHLHHVANMPWRRSTT
jgi:hypothetical protein